MVVVLRAQETHAMVYKLVVFLLAWFGAVSAQADMQSVIAKVKPAVVIVGTYKNTNSPRFGLRGAGFVVGNGNHIITNAHLIEQAITDGDTDSSWVVMVGLEKKELQMRSAVILEVDVVHDLALLSFEGPPMPTLVMRDSRLVQEGQAVAFMGFPIGGALGFSPVTHRGIISSIVAFATPSASAQQLSERTVRTLRSGASFNVFQLDGTAYPGNSGGPLFDPETGEVLGVVNMVFIKGSRESALSQPSGISYAIPSQFILQMLKDRKLN